MSNTTATAHASANGTLPTLTRSEQLERAKTMRGKKLSVIEKKVLRGIESTGQQYRRQFTFTGREFYDFCIPHLRLIIEVDGVDHRLHKKDVRKDGIKEALAFENGYFVERISGFEHPDLYQRARAIVESYRRTHESAIPEGGEPV